LGVILFEDAWVEGHGEQSTAQTLIKLFGISLVARADPSWFPSKESLGAMVATALAALNSPVACYHTSSTAKPLSIFEKDAPPLHHVSALLDLLRSFDGDLQMLRYIATHPLKLFSTGAKGASTWRPDVMPIYHSFDQHVKPAVAYYYPQGTKLPPSELASAPFKPLFTQLFDCVAGINPRRTKYPGDSAFEEDAFVLATREAQRALWCQSWPLTCAQQPRPEIAGTHTLTYSLHEDTLFGIIGQIEVKVGGTAFLVIVKNSANGDGEKLIEESGQRAESVQLEVLRKPTRAVVEGNISKKVRPITCISRLQFTSR
jgi:hypothetical protein